MNKIVIIGCGNVGMSYAYSLLNQRTKVDELVLIDINKERTIGEAMDLNHGLSFAPSKMKIKSGDYSDCNDATIICICAGKNQDEGETRLDLINKNYGVFKSIIKEINKTNFKGIYLIATNPVDIMSLITIRLSKFSPLKVIGSGTMLDTARLRYLLSEKLKVSPKNVHAYVIGEHGDSEFVPWNSAMIGPKSISEYINNKELSKIAFNVRDAAYQIISRKGATYYGIGMCLTEITNAILDNEKSILTVSIYDEENGLYYGMPAIIDKSGVREVVKLNFTDDEKNSLNKSIEILKNIGSHYE